MTDHEMNLLGAKAMKWTQVKTLSELADKDRCFMDGMAIVYREWKKAQAVIWDPVTDLNQAWELFTHVYPYRRDEASVYDTVNTLFDCAASGTDLDLVWRSPSDFARALTEKALEKEGEKWLDGGK